MCKGRGARRRGAVTVISQDPAQQANAPTRNTDGRRSPGPDWDEWCRTSLFPPNEPDPTTINVLIRSVNR